MYRPCEKKRQIMALATERGAVTIPEVAETLAIPRRILLRHFHDLTLTEHLEAVGEWRPYRYRVKRPLLDHQWSVEFKESAERKISRKPLIEERVLRQSSRLYTHQLKTEDHRELRNTLQRHVDEFLETGHQIAQLPSYQERAPSSYAVGWRTG